jgi:hypothetical protein
MRIDFNLIREEGGPRIIAAKQSKAKFLPSHKNYFLKFAAMDRICKQIQAGSSGKDLKDLHEFLKKADNLGKNAKEVDQGLLQLDVRGE